MGSKEWASGRSENDIMKMEYENYYSEKNAQFKHSKRKRTNVDRSYTSESSSSSAGEGSHSHLPERSRPMGQKAAKRRGKKKARDADEETLSTAAKHLKDLSNAMMISSSAATKHLKDLSNAKMMNTAYDIITRDTSAMMPQQLNNHKEVVAFLKRKIGM